MPWSNKAKEGESGLADRYQLYIPKSSGEGAERVGAWFGFPYANAPTSCCLCLYGERSIDGEIDDGHIWLSVGAFEPGDEQGSFAVHETGKDDRYFSQNSKAGKFMASANEVGLLDFLEGRQDPARQQYETKDALMWEDLTLDIEEVSNPERKDEKTGQVFPASRQPLVRGFREGRAFTDGGSSGGSTSAGATTAKANGNGSANDPELRGKAVEAAKASEDWMSYLEAVQPLGIEPGHPFADEAFFKGAKA